MSRVADILDRVKRLDGIAGEWAEYWQSLGDILLPGKHDITSTRSPNERQPINVYDSTPRVAARALASAVDGMTKSRTTNWFWPTVDDEDLAEQDTIKEWLNVVRDRMWRSIYHKDARFIHRSGEVDEGLVVYGIGALFTGENRNRNGLSFRNIPIGRFSIDENSDGVVDTIAITEYFTARQAVQAFGEDNLGPKVLDAFRDPSRSAKKFPFVQLIVPRDDRSAGKVGPDMAFSSIVVDKSGEKIVRESGFHEFPVSVPRWDTIAGQVYSRSPGMMALPDARTAQAIAKTMLVAAQRAADPPTWAYSDAVISPIRTHPGGLTVLSAFDAQNIGGAPLGVLDTGRGLPIGMEMQRDIRESIEAAFFKNVFNLPINTGNMTATEVLERKEEFIRTIGPVFGRLEADYIGHTVERVYGIMSRAGAFPPPPENIGGVPVKFEFMSPIQVARKQMEAVSLGRAFELIGPLAQAQPEILDNLDGDRIVRDVPEWASVPQDWLRSQEEVDAKREQRAQAQQAQELAQAVTVGADAAGKLSRVA